MGKIYKGNVPDQVAATKKYMEEYDEFIFKQQEAEIEELTAEDLRITADCTRQSASGLDQWSPGDFAMMSDSALGHLAALLNRIEQGSAWPKQLMVAGS